MNNIIYIHTLLKYRLHVVVHHNNYGDLTYENKMVVLGIV